MAGREPGRQSPEPEWMAYPVFDVPLPGGGLKHAPGPTE